MTQAKDANTNELNEITSNYLEEFQDKETRHIYVDEFLNTKIATQIKVLREQRGWTQARLAKETGMKQERISVLEDVNYSAWTLSVLRRFAEAFDLRINVSFEDFGSFLNEFANFDRTSLERNSFEDDITFNSKERSKAIKFGETSEFLMNNKPNSVIARGTKRSGIGRIRNSSAQQLSLPFNVFQDKKKDEKYSGFVRNIENTEYAVPKRVGRKPVKTEPKFHIPEHNYTGFNALPN